MVKKTALLMLLLAAPSAAFAAQGDRSRDRVEDVVRCLDIASVEERVRCYDRAAAALRADVRSGEVAVVRRGEERPRRERTPSNFTATVARSQATSDGRWRVTLSNGQVWQTLENQPGAPPAAGTAVRIRRTFVRSIWLAVPGRPDARVARIQ
ncbi:hypothetical protein [Allosphingosinicella sp.]|jgi:hypothetical protein|uniref:hypothetical protein n=1 Tax=Allosphingosinicella sp. TaxID=2823234 RepID=UPI002F0296CD